MKQETDEEVYGKKTYEKIKTIILANDFDEKEEADLKLIGDDLDAKEKYYKEKLKELVCSLGYECDTSWGLLGACYNGKYTQKQRIAIIKQVYRDELMGRLSYLSEDLKKKK